MAAGGDLLGVSVTGALAAQRALSTTGHNISNTNTEGFSRQRVDMHARMPQLGGSGAIGTGVIVDNIDRIYDNFVVTEMRNVAGVSKGLESEFDYSRQVDDMLADPNASLAPSIQEFFAAVNGVANNPTATSERQVLMSQAQVLSNRFEYINSRFENLRDTVRSELRNQVGEVNQLAQGIANLNKTIDISKGIGNKAPSDLLDQRDRLVFELSKKMAVRTTVDDNGLLNVYVGNGQLLVFGQDYNHLEVTSSSSDPKNVDIIFSGSDTKIVITPYVAGGEIGGILNFREHVLDQGQNELGRIAMGMAKNINNQHQLGMDLKGDLGGLFFSEVDKRAPKALSNSKNRGDLELGVQVTNIDKLTVSDYSLDYYNGQYSLRRLSDNTLIGTFSSFPQDIPSEGFKIDIKSGSTVKEGDRFLIQPTREGALGFDLMIKDINRIAAASPIRVESSIDNLGTGKITLEQITDTNGPAFNLVDNEIEQPFAVRFVDENHFELLDNTGKAIKVTERNTPMKTDVEKDDDGVVAHPDEKERPDLSAVETQMEYDRLNGVAIFPTPNGLDPGFRVRVSGEPKAGDVFRIEYNKDGIGDNSNALGMAQLQNKPTLNNGTSNFSEVYSQLVSRIGSRTHELEINHKAQDILLEQAIARREEISGVNLDEEAANLVRYQNLYQANAQVIAVSKSLFDTLIATFSR